MTLALLIFIIGAGILAGLIATLASLLGLQKVEQEKASGYECGFEPYGDARSQYDVKFYQVAIMFLIFDIEVTLLLPMVNNFAAGSK